MIAAVRTLIDNAINEDVTYQSKPLDLRNQRTYAVKVGPIISLAVRANYRYSRE